MGIYDRVVLDASAKISPHAGVIGDVHIGADACVLAGAQIRGDEEPIRIGERSNIQECAVLHVDEGFPLSIGADVTVGHGAIAHGCTIEDGCLIGMGAIVMNGAVVGENCVIAAGALVAEGKHIPPRSMVMGVPGKIVRQLDDEEIERLCRRAAAYYVEVSERMLEEGLLKASGD